MVIGRWRWHWGLRICHRTSTLLLRWRWRWWSPNRLLLACHYSWWWKMPWRCRNSLWRWRRHLHSRGRWPELLLDLMWRHYGWHHWLTWLLLMPLWLSSYWHRLEGCGLRRRWMDGRNRSWSNTISEGAGRHRSSNGTIILRSIGKRWRSTSK